MRKYYVCFAEDTLLQEPTFEAILLKLLEEEYLMAGSSLDLACLIKEGNWDAEGRDIMFELTSDGNDIELNELGSADEFLLALDTFTKTAGMSAAT